MWTAWWSIASAGGGDAATPGVAECPDRPGVEAPDGEALVALLGRPVSDPEVKALLRCWARAKGAPRRGYASSEDHGDLALWFDGDDTLTGITWHIGYGESVTDDLLPFGLHQADAPGTLTASLGVLPPFFATSEVARAVERDGRRYDVRLGLGEARLWSLRVDLPSDRLPRTLCGETTPHPNPADLLGLPLDQAQERLGGCGELERSSQDPASGEEWRGRELSVRVADGVVRQIEVEPIGHAYDTPFAGIPVQGDLGQLAQALPGAEVTCVPNDHGTADCVARTPSLVVAVFPNVYEVYDGYVIRRADGSSPPAHVAAPAPPAPLVAAKPAPVVAAKPAPAPVPRPAPAPQAPVAVAQTLPSLEAAVARTGRKAPNDAAVAIGLEDYPFLHSTVPFAGRDAAAFADLATYTLGVPGDRVITLNRGAREQILDAVRKAGAAAGPGGTVWVFFAGHGAAHPSTGERMVLGDDVRADPVGFEARGVLLTEIEREASAHGAQPLLVLDACYSGAGRDGSSFLGGARFAVPAYARTSGTQWNAAAADQFASPLEPVSHGAFSYFAIGALRGWADGVVDGARDGAVTAAEAQSYVTGMLRRQGIAQQTPVFVGTPDRVLSHGTEIGTTF